MALDPPRRPLKAGGCLAAALLVLLLAIVLVATGAALVIHVLPPGPGRGA